MLPTSRIKEIEMINLLQENIELKSKLTNSTFGFLPIRRKVDPKKTKELFFATTPLTMRIEI